MTDPAAPLSRFESLGGQGEGGAFGQVLRESGLDRETLLRWAELDEAALLGLLESDLAGVGEPGSLIVGPWPGSTEWWIRDVRLNLAVRTFVTCASTPLPHMTPRARHRFRYLRGRMLESLRRPDRVFVYRQAGTPAGEALLLRLGAAIRRHAPAWLLYVRTPAADFPAGTVRRVGEGVLAGALAIAADAAAWRALCAAALDCIDRPYAPAIAEAQPEGNEIRALRRRVAEMPERAPLWARLCEALLRAGRRQEALAVGREGVDSARDGARGFIQLADLLAELGDPEGAARAARRVAQLDEGRSRATAAPSGPAATEGGERRALGPADRLLRRSQRALAEGQAREAAALARQAAALDPGREDIADLLVEALMDCGRAQEALAVVRRGLEANLVQAGWHARLANLLRRLGDLPGAIAAQRDAVGLAPGDAMLRVGLSRLLLDHGEVLASLGVVQEAADLAPEAPRVLWQLAEVCEAAGLYDRAERALRLGAASQPENPEWERRLRRLQNRRDGAAAPAVPASG